MLAVLAVPALLAVLASATGSLPWLRRAPSPIAASIDFAQQLAVPAYIDPSAHDDWSRLLDSETTVRGRIGLLVANPSSGPGSWPDPRWQQRITQAHDIGAKVLAYVDGGYLGTTGTVTADGSTDIDGWLEQILRDITTWHHFYSGIDGVFLDRVQNMCGPDGNSTWAQTYRTLTMRMKLTYPGTYVVANPGSAVPQCLEDVADTLVTFEGTYDTYRSAYVPLTWRPGDPRKIWHLVHDVPSDGALGTLLNLSRSRDAGYVFATQDAMPNPWDSLPSTGFWSAEQDWLGPVHPLPEEAPSAPANLATVDLTESNVTIRWSKAAAGGSPVVAYELYLDGVWLMSTRADRRTVTVPSTIASTHATVTVRARDAAGRVGPASTPFTAGRA